MANDSTPTEPQPPNDAVGRAFGEQRTHVTRSEDRVAFGQKMALGVGAFSNTTGTQILQVMVFPIFQIVLGLHPLLAGIALTVPRVWDALSDPVMGYISDNFRSRFGRRRPFIVVGGLLMAVSLAAIWMVPRSWSQGHRGAAAGRSAEASVVEQTPAHADAGLETDGRPAADSSDVDRANEENRPAGAAENDAQPDRKTREFTARDFWLFGWLVATGLLFYTCYTIYSVPLVSLSYEMTSDYHERTRVMAYWGFFTMAGNLLINWYYPITEQKWLFADRLTAARTVSLLVGVVIFVGLGVVPGLFVKERLYRSASKQAKIALLPAIKETLQSRNMLMLLGMTLSLAFVGSMAAALALYIVMFHVYGGDREAGSILNAWNGVGFQVVGFLSIPVLAWAATHVGKRAAMYLVLGMAAVGGVAKWFLYSPDLFVNVYLPGWSTSLGVPESWLAAPIKLHWLLLDPVLSGPIWVALGMIVPSMMADLCDVDEYEHGKRREGVFGAVFSWIQKVGFSLTFLFAGIAIWLSGFNEKLGADQPAETMFAMRLCFAGFSTLAMIIGMAFLVFYNVSEKRAYEVRAILEQRRGKIPADGEAED